MNLIQVTIYSEKTTKVFERQQDLPFPRRQKPQRPALAARLAGSPMKQLRRAFRFELRPKLSARERL